MYLLPIKIDLLTMRNAALDFYVSSKKHTTKRSDTKQGLDKMFFKKQESISGRVMVSESSVTCNHLASLAK